MWAAVLATAALAALPVGAAAGVGGPPPVLPITGDDWGVRGGAEVQVRLGFGYDQPETWQVEVRVDGVEAEHTLVPDPDGLVGGVSVPAGSRCGPDVPIDARVLLLWGESGYAQDFRGRLHVLCPELAVTPERLQAATPATPLVWEVTGFVPDSVVALRLGEQPVQVVETDEGGGGYFTAPPPEVACGVVPARAIDRSGPEERKEREIPTDLVVEALDRVRVDCPDRPQPEPAVVPAVVQVNPAVVSTGTTTRVTGQQFPPGAPVALSWVLPGGRTVPAGTATADAAGSVRVDLLVMTGSGTGTRQLLAGSGAAAASDQVLVVGGTTQPGRQGLVNRR